MSPPFPDPTYRILPEVRAQLHRGVDPDALEHLLQFFPAPARESHVKMFMNRPIRVGPDGRISDMRTLTQISDPIQQRLLEGVWQPYWSAMTDHDLFDRTGGPPGRELAQQRRRRATNE